MRDLLTSAQGQAPPGEPQPSCPAHAEFVICDCTIEEQFRFQKSELLIESLRLRDWEPRRKLLLLVTLAYGFLLWVLAPSLFLARSRLLVRLQATRRLAAVERQTSCLSAPLGGETGFGSPILPPSRDLAGGLIVPSPTSPGRPVHSVGG